MFMFQATTSQLFNLDRDELQMLSTFLSHSTEVHRSYYRISIQPMSGKYFLITFTMFQNVPRAYCVVFFQFRRLASFYLH
jgi:hypothetical protein